MKDTIKGLEAKMEKTLVHLQSDFSAIRAGRANPAVLDKITVDYYGAPTPINQLAAVSVTEARVLIVQPWDTSVLTLVEKAIQTSDLGINPQNDGKALRIVFPQLTEERRKDIVKEISTLAEETKVAVRNVRRDGIDKLKNMKKDSSITEDDQKFGEKKIQELTDKFVKEIDKMSDKKQKEIMEI